MTGLLVSVRSADEARAALAGGADLIDVKEPSRGALGAANPLVWREVSAVVNDAVPASVALGELVDGGRTACPNELFGFDFIKLGLAGCGPLSDWPSRWSDRLGCLPSTATAVAVVYVDWQAARAPAPELVIEQAARMGCGVVLFDTFEKTHGDLIDHLDIEAIGRFSAAVRDIAARLVLGGSLNARSIPRVLHLEPDYIAVRGAACRCGRNSPVDQSLVAELARVVHGQQNGLG